MPSPVGRPKFSPTPPQEDRSERIATTEWTEAAMQSALVAMWQEIYERTAEPTSAGVPWNRFGHVMVSSAGPTGVGAMAVGETFVVS